jgi:hypothetical protein
MSKPIKTWEFFQWAIVILAGIIGSALFINTAPLLILLCLLAGYGISWICLIIVFGLPYKNMLVQAMLKEW